MTGPLLDAAGWAGAAALLLAYALVSSGRLDGRCARFQLLNLAGALGLLANGIWHGAWPSAALNAVWLVIGAHAIWRLRTTRGNASAQLQDSAHVRSTASGRAPST